MGKTKGKRKAKGVITDFIKGLFRSKRKSEISGPYNVRRHTQTHFTPEDENKHHFGQINIPTSLKGIATVNENAVKRYSGPKQKGDGFWDVVGAVGGLGRHTKQVVPYLGKIGHKVGELTGLPMIGPIADYAMDKSMHGLGVSGMKPVKYKAKKQKRNCTCVKGGSLTQAMRWPKA